MSILTRVTRKEYPGAVTEVRNPYACTNFPTIQALMTNLQTLNVPSVIIEGKIFTEEAKADVEIFCEAAP